MSFSEEPLCEVMKPNKRTVPFSFHFTLTEPSLFCNVLFPSVMFKDKHKRFFYAQLENVPQSASLPVHQERCPLRRR